MYCISSCTLPSSLFTSISRTGSCFGVVCIVRESKLQLAFEAVSNRIMSAIQTFYPCFLHPQHVVEISLKSLL